MIMESSCSTARWKTCLFSFQTPEASQFVASQITIWIKEEDYQTLKVEVLRDEQKREGVS